MPARILQKTREFGLFSRDFFAAHGREADVGNISFQPFSETRTMIRVNITTGDLEAILRQHEIPAREWGQWSALVFQGKRPSKELIHRVHRVPNYIAALKSILIELSKQCKHKFPPPDYKSPCSYESLRCKAS